MARANSSTLTAALASMATSPLAKADLFTFTLVNGTIYRYTDFDQPIKYQPTGDVFNASGWSLIQRSRLSVKNTVEVPELVLDVAASDTDFVGGSNFKTAIHNGLLDGATVGLDRVFLQTPVSGNPVVASINAIGTGNTGILNYPGALFSGRMSEAKITAVGAQLTIKGANVLMNQNVPHNFYQLACQHNFCDAGCTLPESTYTTAQTVGTGSGGPTSSFLPWASVPANPLIYSFGKVTMTSGLANGQVRTIKAATSAGVYLQYPFYDLPAAGDTFNALQGCNKNYNDGSGQSCNDRSNTQHFRGFPFVPVAETAY